MSTEHDITACIQRLRLASNEIRSRFGNLERAAQLVDQVLVDAESILGSLPEPTKLASSPGRPGLHVPFPKRQVDQDS